MKELISVIVPVYNVGPYITQCLESIIGQTYRNLEILLVDDGSKDNGGKICDAYAGRDARIRVLHRENEGVSRARNAALELMKGSYCVFVDGDDWISPDLIEELYQQCKEAGADMAFSSQVFMENEDMPQRSIYSYKNKQTFDNQGAMIDFLTNSAAVLGRLYAREAIGSIRFPEDVKLAEDEVVELEIRLHLKKACFNDKAVYYRRIRPGSASRKSFDENDRKALEIHEQVAGKILGTYMQMEKYVSRFMAARYMETLLKFPGDGEKACRRALLKRYRHWYRQGIWYSFESRKTNLRYFLLAVSPGLYRWVQRLVKRSTI